MTEVIRPLPDLSDPDTAAFWQAAQEHKLTYQVCGNCGRVVFYPRAHCPHCGSLDTSVRESAGEGTVYSFAVIRQTPDPAFRAEVPYVVGLVDLAEGFRMFTRLQAEPESIEMGQRVNLEWLSRDGMELPVFAPVGGGESSA